MADVDIRRGAAINAVEVAERDGGEGLFAGKEHGLRAERESAGLHGVIRGAADVLAWREAIERYAGT